MQKQYTYTSSIACGKYHRWYRKKYIQSKTDKKQNNDLMIQLHFVSLCQQDSAQGDHPLQRKRTKRTIYRRRHQTVQYIKLNTIFNLIISKMGGNNGEFKNHLNDE